MTDWEATCKAFNTYQETARSYDNSCSLRNSDASVSKLMELAAKVKELKTASAASGFAYLEGTQGTELKTAMRDYCCAMWVRKNYEDQLSQAKQDYQIAKQRAESLRNPPADVSYKGTIVPLGRPLRPDSVPVLLSVTFIFFIVALGLLLNMQNIQFTLTKTGPGLTSVLLQVFDSYRQTPLSVLGLTIVGAAAVAGGIFYGILKTKPELLGYKEK